VPAAAPAAPEAEEKPRSEDDWFAESAQEIGEREHARRPFGLSRESSKTFWVGVAVVLVALAVGVALWLENRGGGKEDKKEAAQAEQPAPQPAEKAAPEAAQPARPAPGPTLEPIREAASPQAAATPDEVAKKAAEVAAAKAAAEEAAAKAAAEEAAAKAAAEEAAAKAAAEEAAAKAAAEEAAAKAAAEEAKKKKPEEDAAAKKQAEFEKNKKAALDAEKKGKLDKAEKSLSKALKLNPEDAETKAAMDRIKEAQKAKAAKEAEAKAAMPEKKPEEAKPEPKKEEPKVAPAPPTPPKEEKPAQADPKAESKKFLSLGLQALKANNNALALKYFEKAKTADPSNPLIDKYIAKAKGP
jgi:hypothetical protein